MQRKFITKIKLKLKRATVFQRIYVLRTTLLDVAKKNLKKKSISQIIIQNRLLIHKNLNKKKTNQIDRIPYY